MFEISQAVLSTLISVYICNNSYNFLNNKITELDYYYALNIISIYFTIDLFYLFYNRNNLTNKQMIYHHCVAILSTQFNLIFTTEISLYTMSLLYLSEITTIPFNLCYILNKKKLTNNILFKISGISTLFLYIPFRLFIFPYCSFIAYNNYYYCQCGVLISYSVLNFYWYRKLLNKFLNI